MQYTALGGIKGATFCSTLQLSHRFKMLSWSYKGGFFGNYFRMGQIIASVAQAPLVPALHQQGGNVLVAPILHINFFEISKSSIVHSFATGALVAPPCAPDAPSAQQKSTSSRSRLAKSYGRFATLCLKQDCFFRVHLPN